MAAVIVATTVKQKKVAAGAVFIEVRNPKFI